MIKHKIHYIGDWIGASFKDIFVVRNIADGLSVNEGQLIFSEVVDAAYLAGSQQMIDRQAALHFLLGNWPIVRYVQ